MIASPRFVSSRIMKPAAVSAWVTMGASAMKSWSRRATHGSDAMHLPSLIEAAVFARGFAVTMGSLGFMSHRCQSDLRDAACRRA